MELAKKALFLDRDGVINIEKNYLHKVEDFEFIDGIFELCKVAKSKDYEIFVVTNQSGIARAYYNEDDFSILTSWMIKEFKKNGIDIVKVYYCPHHPDISGECECRKPKPGMILKAKNEFNLDLKNSILVGDSQRDIDSAYRAGLNKAFLFDQNSKTKNSNATKIVSSLSEIISEL